MMPRRLWFAFVLVLLLAGCSVDSPTAPGHVANVQDVDLEGIPISTDDPVVGGHEETGHHVCDVEWTVFDGTGVLCLPCYDANVVSIENNGPGTVKMIVYFSDGSGYRVTVAPNTGTLVDAPSGTKITKALVYSEPGSGSATGVCTFE